MKLSRCLWPLSLGPGPVERMVRNWPKPPSERARPRLRLHFAGTGPAYGRWWIDVMSERGTWEPVTRYHVTSSAAIREAGML